jgi:MarR family transcriptional regulator, temperature-dependent positive regulator of motility
VEQGILGASIALDRSTMASIVNRLELRGLLMRSRPDVDRRKRLLYLTDSGRVTMAALVDRAQELDTLLMEAYGPHGSELIVNMLTRLALDWESVAER